LEWKFPVEHHFAFCQTRSRSYLRFAEVSIGIGVALILAAAWLEMEEVATEKMNGQDGFGRPVA
jgi:hypothetical protein